MTVEKNALKIVNILLDSGYTAYYAGGWVRDYLLKHPSDDVDIATDAPPEKIVELFPKTVEVGISFGVVVVLLEGHQFEVATFREDLEYHDGRRPTHVAYTSAGGDAQRRDFTINGMFFDPIRNKIIDYVEGQKDLSIGIIRAIGDAHERFKEDRLRMVRAVRFAYRFGYQIEKQTEEAILKHAHSLFPAVAMERIWQELKKMARYTSFDQALIKMDQLGLLKEIFPPLKGISHDEIANRVSHFIKLPKKCPPVLAVMELFPDADLEALTAYCYYLKVSNQEIKLVEFAHCVRVMAGDEDADWAPIYAHLQIKTVLEVVCAKKNPSILENHQHRMARLQPHTERVIQRKPVVTAALLQKEGIIPGKQLGDLLKAAQRLSINENIEDPQEVIDRLKQSSVWS